MNDAERKAMLEAEDRYTSNLEPSEIGYAPLDFKAGWQAALEWRDSQVGEPVAQSRGWALLGTGRYVLSHTNDFHPELGAELIITFATEDDTQGNRQIGEVRDNPNCGKPIEAKDMIIRIGFLNERALFALENQLSLLRKQHFPDSTTPRTTQINQAGLIQ